MSISAYPTYRRKFLFDCVPPLVLIVLILEYGGQQRITAAISMSALTTNAPAGTSERVATLRSLATIRERCGVVFEAAKSDKLEHFRLNLAKLDDVATFVQGMLCCWSTL